MSKPRLPAETRPKTSTTPPADRPITPDSDLLDILRAKMAVRTEILRRTAYEDYLVVKAQLDALPPFLGLGTVATPDD